MRLAMQGSPGTTLGCLRGIQKALEEQNVILTRLVEKIK